MARETRRDEAAPRPRQSKTMWPWIFMVVLAIALLILVAWGLGWWEADPAGDLPAS